MTDQIVPGLIAHDVALDHVVPFQVDALEARGRAVLMGPAIDQILSRHDYPQPVARLLAEMTALTVLLGTSMKFQGKFIVQTQTDGPVSLLVVDFTTPDAVRAYARFDDEAVSAAIASGATTPEDMLGKGVLVLTVDQGQYMQRYQGIVELDGASLEEVAVNYFRQSEQIPTIVRLAVGTETVPAGEGEKGSQTQWRAGGIMTQFLPEAPERMRMGDLHPGEIPDGAEWDETAGEDDAWTEVKALVGTVDDDELIDPTIGAHRLLFRLFHERGVRVFEEQVVADKCSCSREKVHEVLQNLGEKERGEAAEATEDGKIAVTCEFCSTRYAFSPDDFEGDGASE